MPDEAVHALAREVRSGSVSPAPRPDEPEALGELRRALAEGRSGQRAAPQSEGERASAGDDALDRIARYLRNSVVRPLDGAGKDPKRLTEAATRALDALADLEFFTQDRKEEVRSDNLSVAVQETTREFGLEYAVPVRVRGSERPVRARFPSEGLKDALYLLMVNGARFSGDRVVEVVVEDGDHGPTVRVLDRGRGFSPEALEKGTEPFFTTESDSLGLGLTHARQVVERSGGRLILRNRDDGGAEVEIRLPPPS